MCRRQTCEKASDTSWEVPGIPLRQMRLMRTSASKDIPKVPAKLARVQFRRQVGDSFSMAAMTFSNENAFGKWKNLYQNSLNFNVRSPSTKHEGVKISFVIRHGCVARYLGLHCDYCWRLCRRYCSGV